MKDRLPTAFLLIILAMFAIVALLAWSGVRLERYFAAALPAVKSPERTP